MKPLISIALLLSSLLTFGQDLFENKKEEKFYFKLEEAYASYDYDMFLDNEEEIKTTFLSREDTIAANAYTFLGEAYYFGLGELQQALDYYNAELDLRKKIQPEATNNGLIFNIANIQSELGYYDKAEELFIQVMEADKESYGKDSYEYYTSAMGLVDFYLQTEATEDGLEVLSDIKKSAEKNSIEEAIIFKTIGDFYSIDGSYSKAEKNYFMALDIVENNGLEANIEYVSILNSLGILYTDKAKLPQAEETFNLAISTLDRIQGENEDWRNSILSNLSRVYFDLGDYDRAQSIQEEVSDKDKVFYGEDSFIYAQGLLNLARTYTYNNDPEKAEALLKKAIVIFSNSSGEDDIFVAKAQSQLAFLLNKEGRIDESINYGEASYQAHVKTVGEDNFETAFPLYSLANSYMIKGDVDKAKESAEASLKIRRKLYGKSHPLYAKNTNQLAILNWKVDNHDAARTYYRETFENFFNQINAYFPVLTEEEKAKFYYANVKPAFEQYISFTLASTQDDPQQLAEMLGEIYNYQLALKGIILYATKKVRESINSSGDSVLITKYGNWIAQKEQLAKLYSANDMDVDLRNQQIDSLTEQSNRLEEELSIASKTFGESFASKDITWEDVRGKLKPGEAAVEMIRYKVFSPDSAGYFTDDVYYAALIVKHDTGEAPEMVIIPNGRKMETKYLSNYRNAIRYRIKENYSYKLFWDPIGKQLEGIKKVYFSPDGVYNQVSIYTFRNPVTNEYLVEEFDLQVVTNTKDLVTTTPSEENLEGVFFGYPNYNMGAIDEGGEVGDERGMRGLGSNERSMRGTRGGEMGTLRGEVVPRGIRGNLVRYMRSFNSLALLPGTKKEVENIDSLYSANGEKAITYFENEAIESQVKEVKNPSTLHIATHGFFLELDPDDITADTYVQNPLLRSGLIMAGANSFIQTGQLPGTDEDGILTAYEAMNLNLDETDIVVLSACETGLGEIRNGEGVYGLQRAFKIAGADAIIMSMWSVDDNATQELMNNFYEEWITGVNKGDAFIAAQKRLKEKYPDPFFWGAFVMVGN